MKKTELASMLKPLIKECIKEVMFEDGVLSGIISEVAHGMAAVSVIQRETAEPIIRERQPDERRAPPAQQKQKLNEYRKGLLDAIGKDAYNGVNLFEGTTPMDSPPSPGATASPSGPLAGVSPTDSGVDISNLFGTVGARWKTHVDAGK